MRPLAIPVPLSHPNDANTIHDGGLLEVLGVNVILSVTSTQISLKWTWFTCVPNMNWVPDIHIGLGGGRTAVNRADESSVLLEWTFQWRRQPSKQTQDGDVCCSSHQEVGSASSPQMWACHCPGKSHLQPHPPSPSWDLRPAWCRETQSTFLEAEEPHWTASTVAGQVREVTMDPQRTTAAWRTPGERSRRATPQKCEKLWISVVMRHAVPRRFVTQSLLTATPGKGNIPVEGIVMQRPWGKLYLLVVARERRVNSENPKCPVWMK